MPLETSSPLNFSFIAHSNGDDKHSFKFQLRESTHQSNSKSFQSDHLSSSASASMARASCLWCGSLTCKTLLAFGSKDFSNRFNCTNYNSSNNYNNSTQHNSNNSIKPKYKNSPEAEEKKEKEISPQATNRPHYNNNNYNNNNQSTLKANNWRAKWAQSMSTYDFNKNKNFIQNNQNKSYFIIQPSARQLNQNINNKNNHINNNQNQINHNQSQNNNNHHHNNLSIPMFPEVLIEKPNESFEPLHSDPSPSASASSSSLSSVCSRLIGLSVSSLSSLSSSESFQEKIFIKKIQRNPAISNHSTTIKSENIIQTKYSEENEEKQNF